MNKLPYEVVRKEVDTSHYYWIDDEFVPATTEILGIAGPVEYGLRQFWQNNTASDAKKAMDEAAAFGTLIHENIEKLLYGEKINTVEQSSAMPFYKKSFDKHIMAFYDWFHQFNPDVISIKPEHVVGSKKYKYGGTIDLFCTKDKESYIIDFKTASGIHYSHELQLAAYKNAYEELYGIKIDHCYILRTGSQHKTGYEFKEVDRKFDEFLNVYNTYLSLNNGKIPEPPEVEIIPEELQLFTK